MQTDVIVPRRRSLKQMWQRFLQIKFWQMDIASSAWIAGSALIDRTYPRGVHIGADVYIDEHAVILTHDMSRRLYLDTTIGDRSIVGARAIILPGVTVGKDCIVAPGAVVTRDLPDKSQVSGNPARTIVCADEH